MSKSKNKKNVSKKKNQTVTKQGASCETNIVSPKNWVELQAEAYYLAMKRFEEEKALKDQQVNSEVKTKWWKRVLVFINVVLFPFHIFGKKRINNQIYDEILVLPVSTLLIGGGSFFWLIGVAAFVAMITRKMTFNVSACVVSFFVIIVGSFMIVSGRAFKEERDSMKIYAYSASIIALVSCIVSIVALIIK